MERKFEILIVDDDANLALNLQDVLEVEGYSTVVAHDGQTTLTLCREKVFDLAIVDIKLPDISGVELIQKLADLSPGREYIIITGYASLETAVEAVKRKSIVAYETKPLNIDHLLALITQVVERKQAEEELQQTVAELERSNTELQGAYDKLQQSSAQLVQAEKMGAVGVIAAGIAHELLNPMMGILNYAQYCLKCTAEDDPRHNILQDMERETERCIDTVKNVLTFSRMEKEGEEGYQKESFAPIIERVVKLLSYRIEAEKVTLTSHIAEGTPAIWLKVNGMQQVLLNLINNAMDTLKESQKKEVNVKVRKEGDSILVTVSDSGSGISPENMDKIFDPFFTTKAAGQGTGLGLTVVRSIIQAHGGEITCESKLGAGTTFKVLLPIEKRGREGT